MEASTKKKIDIEVSDDENFHQIDSISPIKALGKSLGMASMIFISTIFIPLPMVINTYWLGHEASSDSLAGFALGQTTISIIVFHILRGMANGLQTLVAQAHG